MALVRYGGRHINALGTLVTAARVAYRYRNVLQNTYNMVKRSYDAAFPSPRGTVSKRTRWNNSKAYRRPWRRRTGRKIWRKYRSRLARVINPRKNRRRGRRVPPNRDLILRTSTRYTTTFTAEPGNEVDFNSKKIEMDDPGDWFPGADEVTPMDRCRFDNCNAKKLKSVHLYMKNISVSTWYDTDQTKQFVSMPNDTYVYTYADQRNPAIGDTDVQGKYIRTQGLAKKLVRNQADYHSILKANCYSRNTTDTTFLNMSTIKWKSFTRDQEFFNKTASTHTDQGHLNIDHLINVDTPYTAPDNGTKFHCKLEYDMVVATRWRLYGTKDTLK